MSIRLPVDTRPLRNSRDLRLQHAHLYRTQALMP